MTYQEFLLLHYQRQPIDDLRLGQRFVNTYIKGSWPWLFYEESEAKAAQLILKYLDDLQYFPDMPPEVR